MEEILSRVELLVHRQSEKISSSKLKSTFSEKKTRMFSVMKSSHNTLKFALYIPTKKRKAGQPLFAMFF